MIAKLIGFIDEVLENKVLINVNGVCYEVVISNNAIAELSQKAKSIEIAILVQQITKEDGSTLYGFLDKENKDWFNELIKINGLGPKFAMSLLSCLSVKEMQSAIITKDEDILTKANGIGKKLANRIVNEMQSKAKKFDISAIAISSDSKRTSIVSNQRNSIQEDAINALIKLGFQKSICISIVNEAINNSEKELNLEELIKISLGKI